MQPRRLVPLARMIGGLCTPVLALATAAGTAEAIPVVHVWNSPPTPDGAYVNAPNLAQNMFFTSVTLTADSEVRYLEAVNLGSTPFGTNSNHITHTAPTLTILADIRIGNGNFSANVSHVNLSGSIRNQAGASIASAARLPGITSTVSIASNAANLQQAVWFTQSSAGVSTVTAPFGTSTSLTFDSDTHMILSGGQVSGSVAMNHASSLLELRGSGFEIDTGSGFVPIGWRAVNALSGQLRGTLDSGDAILVSFTQGGPGRIQIFGPAVPTAGETLLGVAAALALAGVVALRAHRANAGLV